MLLLALAALSGCYANTDYFPKVCLSRVEVSTQKLDYSLEENWAYFGIKTGLKEADLFLIAPTVFLGKENVFNMSVGNDVMRQRFINALNMQRGIYEETCRMFAPFYRQAGLNVYSIHETDATEYFSIAYIDIRNAFMHYIQNYNNGRPLVIAGFSQGADMALRLMKEFGDTEKIKKILVAAYIIGWRVTENDISAYPFLRMAQGETDTGVIVSFNTEAEGVEYSIIVPERTLGINPLNWHVDNTIAPRYYNKGACFPNYYGEIIKEIPHLTGAYIDLVRGVLKVTDINHIEFPPVLDLFGEGVYHIYDYQFFYRNLQENVAARVRVFTSLPVESIPKGK